MASIRDSNLYTLLVRPSPDYPNVLQLIDSSRGSEVRYLRVREESALGSDGKPKIDYATGGYDAGLYDAYTNAKLASVSASSLKAKNRRLELHNPDILLPFEFSGGLSFEWTFTFEGHKFRWTRPAFHSSDYVCSVDRKPDPSVQLCLGRESVKGKDGIIQLLDYALERFDFEDKKGLEIAMYTSLLSILDAVDDRLSARDKGPAPPAKVSSPAGTSNRTRGGSNSKPKDDSNSKPKDEEIPVQADPNEVFVQPNGSTEEYAMKAVSSLADPSVLFVVIKTRQAEAAQKAVEVASATKRARHRAGLDQDSRGLYQYVIEEEIKASPSTARAQAGPRVIDLNDPKDSAPKRSESKAWRPPPNISIYLSKIELPDLNPSRLAAQGRIPDGRTPPNPSRPSPPVAQRNRSEPTAGLKPPVTSTARPSSAGPARPNNSGSQQRTSPVPATPQGKAPSKSKAPSGPSTPGPISQSNHLPPEAEPFGLGKAGSKIAARLFSSK